MCVRVGPGLQVLQPAVALTDRPLLPGAPLLMAAFENRQLCSIKVPVRPQRHSLTIQHTALFHSGSFFFFFFFLNRHSSALVLCALNVFAPPLWESVCFVCLCFIVLFLPNKRSPARLCDVSYGERPEGKPAASCGSL